MPQQAGRLGGNKRFPVFWVSRSPALEDCGLLLERGIRVSAIPRICHKRCNCSFDRDVVRIFRRYLRRWGGLCVFGRPGRNARSFPFERQSARRFEVASLVRRKKLRRGQLHARTIEGSTDQDWTFRALTGTASLIPFFSCAGWSVAALDVQHLDAVPASILNLLARFGTLQSAKSM